MVAVLIIVIAVVVFLALSRVGVLTARREKRSIEHYWEAMGVLAELSARERATSTEQAPGKARSALGHHLGRAPARGAAPAAPRRSARLAEVLVPGRKRRGDAGFDEGGRASGAPKRAGQGPLSASRRRNGAGRGVLGVETSMRAPATTPASFLGAPERRREAPPPRGPSELPPPRPSPRVAEVRTPPPRVPPPVPPGEPIVFVDDAAPQTQGPQGAQGLPRVPLGSPLRRSRARGGSRPFPLRPGEREAGRVRRWAVVLASGACAAGVVVAAVVALGGGSAPSGHPGVFARGRGSAEAGKQRPALASLVAEDASTASYAVRATPVVVVLGATGPCWVEARAGQGGPLLFEGTLGTDATKTFTDPRGIWLRVGDAAHADIVVNGVPVPEAPSGPDPYDFSFAHAGG